MPLLGLSLNLDAPTHILQCSHDVYRDIFANHSLDFAVECSWDMIDYYPYDTQVQLVQGDTEYTSSGYVEVYLNDRWGPVCNMQSSDADSACMQLGYSGASSCADKYGLNTGSDDQLDSFNCGDFSYPCLRYCYDYPKPTYRASCPRHTVVTCKFSNYDVDSSYGSQSLCTTSHVSTGLIVGVAVGVAVLLQCILAGCVCCCVFYSTTRRERVAYETI